MRRATLAAVLLAASASVRAADFTFKVPVNLQDYVRPESLPGGEAIVCDVFAPGAKSHVGNGSATLPIPPSGNLNTTVTVEVNATGPGRKENASDYRCYFLLANAPRTTAEQALAQTAGITLTPKPGTTPVVLVTGKIPK
jgi:hypothetical protein